MWWVYVMSNANRTLYVGMTSDVTRRVVQHKSGVYDNAFTKRYNFDKLVYFEEALTQTAAAKREKQIKGWIRAKKIALIESVNPDWRDLNVDWSYVFR
jgi:putative endonuclease